MGRKPGVIIYSDNPDFEPIALYYPEKWLIHLSEPLMVNILDVKNMHEFTLLMIFTPFAYGREVDPAIEKILSLRPKVLKQWGKVRRQFIRARKSKVKSYE